MHLSHCERLKLVRKESNGLTQQQLSHLIEIPLHKIKSIETDKKIGRAHV